MCKVDVKKLEDGSVCTMNFLSFFLFVVKEQQGVRRLHDGCEVFLEQAGCKSVVLGQHFLRKGEKVAGCR